LTIHIVGGTYKEYCAWPEHNTLQGSAGRAALCLSQLDPSLAIKLHSRIAEADKVELEEVFVFSKNCELDITDCPKTTKFDYFHPLSEPKVTPKPPLGVLPEFDLTKEEIDSVVVFGMIEASPVIKCRVAIYDPQNTYNPVLFSEIGSATETLVYVTNSNELSIFYTRKNSKPASIEVMSEWLSKEEGAEAVVVKCGQRGVYAYSESEKGWITPYKTEKVFPIGSGDSFVAAFSFYWLIKGMKIIEATNRSSIAAAYYVSHKTMNNEQGLEIFSQDLEPLSSKLEKKKIYLAGPFFTLSELWMVNEAKQYIESFGMNVFSPYHELGIGSAEEVVQKDIDAIYDCDVIYALFDGTDPGTLFEIGFARSASKPVIILAENPKAEELKMYDGSGCKIFSDFSSSIYHLAWLEK